MGKAEKKTEMKPRQNSGSKWRRRLTIAGVSVGVLLALLVGICAIFVSDYYRSDMGAIEKYSEALGSEIEKTVTDHMIVYGAKDAEAGFIFYPGAKVEFTSYEPMMLALAEQGIFCALVEMPFNIAMLDMDAADTVRAQYPEISRWYIGGHSLGGSIAGMYLEENAAEYEGLILVASYSMTDLSGSNLKVLSVYGSEDGVLNMENYAAYKACLPADMTEVIIEGGNHAYFGMYGEQDGDGTVAIAAEEQIRITVEEIVKLVEE